MQGKYAGVLLAAAVALAFSPCCMARSILCSSQISPNSTELLPHPGSCALYLTCDHGYPVVSKCPQGLHFNRDLQVCDWPNAAGCIEAMKKKHAEEEAAKTEEQNQEEQVQGTEEQTTPEPVTASEIP